MRQHFTGTGVSLEGIEPSLTRVKSPLVDQYCQQRFKLELPLGTDPRLPPYQGGVLPHNTLEAMKWRRRAAINTHSRRVLESNGSSA